MPGSSSLNQSCLGHRGTPTGSALRTSLGCPVSASVPYVYGGTLCLLRLQGIDCSLDPIGQSHISSTARDSVLRGRCYSRSYVVPTLLVDNLTQVSDIFVKEHSTHSFITVHDELLHINRRSQRMLGSFVVIQDKRTHDGSIASVIRFPSA